MIQNEIRNGVITCETSSSQTFIPKPNKWKGYTIICWKEHNYSEREDPEYLEDIDGFEKSIICYLELFNALPIKGMDLANLTSDIVNIFDITFYGLDKEIRFDLKDIND